MPAKKLPKSMGKCADLYYDAKQARLAADRAAAELKAEEERIKNHIIDNLKKDDTGAAGQHHRVQVVRKWKPRVDAEKWPQFYAWVSKNKAFDMLQKRISDDAVRERMAVGKKIPGVTKFDYVDVSLTKVG
jgi:hypothetical protein